MHLLKYADALAIRGEGRIFRANYAKIPDAPCRGLEHRGGTCPAGIDHRIEDYEKKNTILASLKGSVIDQLAGEASPLDLTITQIATGTSSAATTSGMTQAAAEYYRDAPTSVLAASATQVIAFWFFGDSVANAGSLLQEWVILAGGATNTPGSGTAIARFLQSFDKNALTTASGQWTGNIA